MRNLKKFLALVLAMMMTLSLMVTVNAASSDFKDKDDITPAYAEAIDVLSELGVIKGQGEGDPNEGKFMPNDPITRGEVSAILYRIVTGDVSGSNLKLYTHKSVFTDVNADDWFAPYVNFCENNRLIEGVGNNKFAPRDNINGYEALTMILRAIGYDNRNEYRQVEWRTWASGWGNKLHLTDNIAAGSLGAPATREMVAEIMFKGIQAPMVNYSILNQYTPELLVDASEVNTAPGDPYAADIPNTLLYQTFKIVGKSETLTFDDFGRPKVMWITDVAEDNVEDGTKYIENIKAVNYAAGDETEGADEARISLTMSTVAKYDNAVTECQVAKNINSDKKVAWKNIAEVLNGNAEAKFEGTTGTKIGTGNTLTYAAGALHKDDSPDMDALHTSDKWIGATGRTTEIYDISDYDVTDKLAGGDDANAQKYVIVYVDTYLAEVKSITEAVKDPNDHEIKAATAIVKMGTDEIEVSLSSAKSYNVGDLVLVQTANGAMTGINLLAAGEKVPETPTDVDVVAAAAFPNNGSKCALVDKADIKRVTIKATVGTRDAKMGIIPEDGNAIYASNTFLANKTAGAAKSVLPEWWDVDDAAKGITNSMIGRTFDLVLDQNGYIVGMKEVLTTDSNVGIITGYDQHRVSSGKYVTAVEAYMSDGTTQTFNVVNMGTTANAQAIAKDREANKFDTSKFGFFKSGAAADDAWDVANGIYAKDAKLGIGALVMFKQCTVDGVAAWYFEDASDITTANVVLKDKDGTNRTDNLMVGTALSASASFNTGNALAIETTLDLDNADSKLTMIDHQLDNKSIIFVAEPEYAYNTGKENEGDNTLKYNVYEGFRTMPTITQASGAQNILFQQLVNHPEYVLVYPQQSNLEYIIRNQETITVDDSYLVLSRGATYAGYSEYNVLKNGKADVLQVSNSNTSLNEAVEAAMKAGNLLVVTGRNSAGYVIAVDTLVSLAANDDVIAKNCGGVGAAGAPDPLVDGAAGTKFSENDGVLNFNDATADRALTLADNCTIQLVNLGTGAVKDITIGVAKVYINKEGSTQAECDFTFELDQYGYVCSLYVIEQ